MTIPWSTGLTPATAATLAASLRPGLNRFCVVIAAYVSSPTAPGAELTAGAGATAIRAAAAGSGRVTKSDRTMPTANATQTKPSTILISRSRRDIVVRPRAGSTEPAIVRWSGAPAARPRPRRELIPGREEPPGASFTPRSYRKMLPYYAPVGELV